MSTRAKRVEPDEVTVVDSEPAFRVGLSSALQDAGYRVEQATQSVARAMHADRPKVLITDRPASNLDLLEVVAGSRKDSVALAILDDVTAAATAEALRLGATAVVERRSGADQIVRTLRLAGQGVTVLPTDVARDLADNLADGACPGDLTEQDVTFLRLLKAGRTMSQIADDFSCSERTLYRYQQALYRRMGVANRLAALAAAAQWDVVD